MSNLVALVFRDQYAADEARAALRRLEGEGVLDLDETATIVKKPDGKVRLSQDLDLVGKDRDIGHWAGIAAAAITGTVPLIMVGTLGGALVGKLSDHGVTNQLINRLGKELHPGTSILVLCGSSDAVRRKRIAERLVPWNPTILESTLPSELEAEFKELTERTRRG